MTMKTPVAAALALAISLCMSGCGTAPSSADQEKPQDATTAVPAAEKDPEAVDKSELRKMLSSQEQYKETDYPEEAWNNYRAALEKAYAVNADEEASQDEVDSAKSNLGGSEHSLINATSKDHPKKFDYDWYKSNRNNRDGYWVAAACMVSIAFQDEGKRYLIATIANDDATLSNHDVLLQGTDEASLDEYTEGDVLAILGTTEEMKEVAIGKSYSEWLPVINAVEIQEAP